MKGTAKTSKRKTRMTDQYFLYFFSFRRFSEFFSLSFQVLGYQVLGMIDVDHAHNIKVSLVCIPSNAHSHLFVSFTRLCDLIFKKNPRTSLPQKLRFMDHVFHFVQWWIMVNGPRFLCPVIYKCQCSTGKCNEYGIESQKGCRRHADWTGDPMLSLPYPEVFSLPVLQFWLAECILFFLNRRLHPGWSERSKAWIGSNSSKLNNTRGHMSKYMWPHVSPGNKPGCGAALHL